jgi:hypothetical protein
MCSCFASFFDWFSLTTGEFPALFAAVAFFPTARSSTFSELLCEQISNFPNRFHLLLTLLGSLREVPCRPGRLDEPDLPRADLMSSCISPPFRFPFMVKMSISVEHLHFCDARAAFLERITI